MGLLPDLPSVDDHVALAEPLRGMKDTGIILGHLQRWEVPQERIDRIAETIRQQE